MHLFRQDVVQLHCAHYKTHGNNFQSPCQEIIHIFCFLKLKQHNEKETHYNFFCNNICTLFNKVLQKWIISLCPLWTAWWSVVRTYLLQSQCNWGTFVLFGIIVYICSNPLVTVHVPLITRVLRSHSERYFLLEVQF